MLVREARCLTLLDLSDVYMTFYLPTDKAGQVSLGAEARIVLDALPNQPIPARVTFVSPQPTHPQGGGNPY